MDSVFKWTVHFEKPPPTIHSPPQKQRRLGASDLSHAAATCDSGVPCLAGDPRPGPNVAMAAIKLQQWPVAMEHANQVLVLTGGKDAKVCPALRCFPVP